MVKLVCLTWQYHELPFERALEGIAQAGFRYVAFGLPHGKVGHPIENDERSIAETEALLAKYKLQPAMLSANAQFKPDQPVERAVQWLNMAKRFGIGEVLSTGTWGYRTFPAEPLAEEEMEAADQRFVEHYRQIADEAAKLDIKLSLKPHTGNTATAGVLLKTLQRINRLNLGGSYDPGNVHYYEGVDAGKDFPQMASRTHSLLIKDHRGGKGNRDFPLPGTGDVDFPRIFAALQKANFQGNVAVERVCATYSEDPATMDRLLRETRMYLERAMHKAGFDFV
jgi:sugar phosphate isomerase/epimerase